MSDQKSSTRKASSQKTADDYLASLTPAERLERRKAIVERRETFWMPEESRTQLLEELACMAQIGMARQMSLAIVAEANSGKTALLKHYCEQHPPYEQEDESGSRTIMPAILIDMSLLSRVEDLSVALLRQLGATDPEAGSHTQRLYRFLHLAKEMKLGLVLLDEFHEAADTTGKGKPFLKCIKGLMNQGVVIVLAGTAEVRSVLMEKQEFSTRYDYECMSLDVITDLQIVKALLMKITALPNESISNEAVMYIIEQSRGVFGNICDLTQRTFISYNTLELAGLKSTRAKMRSLDHPDLKAPTERKAKSPRDHQA